MLIDQCARVIFVHSFFPFLAVIIESKQYFIDQNLIQDFSRLLCKIHGFQGLEFDPIKFKTFKDPAHMR